MECFFYFQAFQPFQPSATNAALEFITIEGIGPVHDELKVVKFPPLSIAGGPCRFVGIHFIKTRMDTLLFRASEICLSPVFGVGCLSLVFIARLFPPAKGEGGKADINVAVFHGGNLLLILLVDVGKILRLVCWNPLPLVLLQTAHCCEL